MNDVSPEFGKQQKFEQKIVGYKRNWGGEPIARTPQTENLFRMRSLIMDGGVPGDAAGAIAVELFYLQQQVTEFEAQAAQVIALEARVTELEAQVRKGRK